MAMGISYKVSFEGDMYALFLALVSAPLTIHLPPLFRDTFRYRLFHTFINFPLYSSYSELLL